MSSDDEKTSMEDFEEFERDTDEMYRLMTDLSSKDPDVSRCAMEKLDAFVADRKRKRDEKFLLQQGGCKTIQNRTVINNRESDLEKRKRLSEEFRQLGNECFRGNNFNRAKEYYTSAILQFDESAVLYNNRAQTNIRLKEFDAAIEDCKTAMKLQPELVKTYVIMAKALRGQMAFNQAVNILEIAQSQLKEIKPNENKILEELKDEILKEMIETENKIQNLG